MCFTRRSIHPNWMTSRGQNKRYIHTVTIDIISMTAGGGDWVKLYGIASFWGQNLASVVVAAGNMVLEEGHERPIAVVAHHPRPLMTWCRLLVKSFVEFRPMELVQLLLEAFVGGDATIFRQEPTTAGTTTEWQGLPVNGFRVHQTTTYYILAHLMCQSNVFCDEIGHNRVESMLKSDNFFVSGRENRLCEEGFG